MAQSQNTGSTLSFPSGKNRTSTALSTNIIITVGNGNPVGAVQELSVSEKRAIKQIDEIGTDGHIDSAPQSSTNITGSCRRVRFDAARITEAFGRGFIHASSQAYPFDIIIMDKSRSEIENQITTVIKNVWIGGIDVTYSSDNWIIIENMTWEAERIFSYRSGNTNVPAATGGIRPIPTSKITREQLADRGADGRGGSLDASGLIDLGSSGDLF
jgi:hypothetical protein